MTDFVDYKTRDWYHNPDPHIPAGSKRYDSRSGVWYYPATGRTAPPPGGFEGYEHVFIAGSGFQGQTTPLVGRYEVEQTEPGPLTLGNAWTNPAVFYDADYGAYVGEGPYGGGSSGPPSSVQTGQAPVGGSGYNPSPFGGSNVAQASPFYVPGSTQGTTGGGNIYGNTGNTPPGPGVWPPKEAPGSPMEFTPYGDPAGVFTKQMLYGGPPRSAGDYYGVASPFLTEGVGTLPGSTPGGGMQEWSPLQNISQDVNMGGGGTTGSGSFQKTIVNTGQGYDPSKWNPYDPTTWNWSDPSTIPDWYFDNPELVTPEDVDNWTNPPQPAPEPDPVPRHVAEGWLDYGKGYWYNPTNNSWYGQVWKGDKMSPTSFGFTQIDVPSWVIPPPKWSDIPDIDPDNPLFPDGSVYPYGSPTDWYDMPGWLVPPDVPLPPPPTDPVM